jgi:hypothetical protein
VAKVEALFDYDFANVQSLNNALVSKRNGHGPPCAISENRVSFHGGIMGVRKYLLFFAVIALSFQNCAKVKMTEAEPSQIENAKGVMDYPTDADEPEAPVVPGGPTPVVTNEPKTPEVPYVPPKPPSPPKPTGKFICVHRAGTPTVVEDLYEKWSDGSVSLKEKCSDWHSTVKENHGYNCGAPAGYPINQGFSACCPMGSVTVNGRCLPEVGLGESCYADANCKAGLKCRDDLADTNTYRRRICQPAR